MGSHKKLVLLDSLKLKKNDDMAIEIVANKFVTAV